MVKIERLVLLAACALVSGCIVPRPLATGTEVIRSADSAPAFGPQAAFHFGQNEPLTVAWEAAPGAYVPRENTGGLFGAFRVARLKGSVYLLQVQVEEAEGYVLVPFQVSQAREVAPLSCDLRRAAAAEFGVRMPSADGALYNELRGDRASVIALLVSALEGCRPLLQVDTFVPPGPELAATASPGDGEASVGCKPCPRGACIQGRVTDQTGASIIGATVRVAVRGAAVAPGSIRTNEKGEFLLAGVPDGTCELSVEMTGFAGLKAAAFPVKAGATYLFDDPLEMTVGPDFETTTVSQEPFRCPPPRRKP